MIIQLELPAFMAAQSIDWAGLYRYDFLPFCDLQKAKLLVIYGGEATISGSDILRGEGKDQMTACCKLS